MGKLIDLTGNRYGILTVQTRAKNRNGDTIWLCKCDCGNSVEVRADSLRRGATKSCGCATNQSIAKTLKKHGLRRSRLYGVWNAMIQRCENENNHEANLYGGRGIKVCEEWHDFSKFKDWALENGYSEKLTIDRIDNNKGYYPENCRLTDLITQANNKRTNVRIEYDGETKTIAQWAREFHIDYRIFWQRLKRGWDMERALTWGVSA